MKNMNMEGMSNLDIKEAQQIVYNHLKKVGYTEIETTPTHAFLYLIEEIGEVSRTLLHKETKRGSYLLYFLCP